MTKTLPIAMEQHSWRPGQSGNPNGRPVGSRTIFSNAYLADLVEVWGTHGKEAMIWCATKKKDVFFATCARMIPTDVAVTVNQNYGALDPTDIAILRAVKNRILNANDRAPAEVFQYVDSLIAADQAKLVSSVSIPDPD